LKKEKFDSNKNQIQNIKSEISSLVLKIKELQNFKTDDTLIDELELNISELNSSYDNSNKSLVLLKKDLIILEFWKRAFSDSGIKSMLIDMAIPHMNEYVANALELIAPGIFTVSFDTLKTNKSGEIKDKFNVNVLHNIKGTDSHKTLSGGEKRTVDLACMASLRSLAENMYQKRFHHILYDEVLDSLDSESCESFGKAVRLLYPNTNITLISHTSVENVEPDRVFNF